MLDVKGLFQLAARLRNFALIELWCLYLFCISTATKTLVFFAVSYLIAAGLLLLVLITSIVIILI